MTDLITRCPKCATAFNVTETHLKTANGAVRCGSCLSVFNGRENIVHTLTQKSNPLLDKDDLLVSDDFVKKHQPAPSSHTDDKESFSDAHDDADDDESWALKLLEEEGHDPLHLGLGSPSVRAENNRSDQSSDTAQNKGTETSTSNAASSNSNSNINVAVSEKTPEKHQSQPDNLGISTDSNSTRGPSTSSSVKPDPLKRGSLLDTELKGAESYDTTIVIPTEAYETQAKQNDLSDITANKTAALAEITAQEAFTEKTAVENTAAKDSGIESFPISDITAEDLASQGSKISDSVTETEAAIEAIADLEEIALEEIRPRAKEIQPRAKEITATDTSSPDTKAFSSDFDDLAKEPEAISGTTPEKTEAQQASIETKSEEPAAEEPLNEPTAAARKAQEYVASKAEQPEPEAIIDEKDLEELQEVINAAQNQTNAAPHVLSDAIEAEAVEMQYTAKRSAWLGKVLWFILAVVAALALAAQVAWLKFDEWSTKEPYRQYYVLACEHIGCSVPQLKDMSKIRTSNLLVRSHPSTENALLVDVVLQNHASFKQPFPKLVLVFSNIKNKVVASRAFEPTEYLGGDLQGASMMPIRKPIHLSLELVDPGKGADSYKIMVEE